MTLRVACVLRSGGDFTPADVHALKRGFERHLPGVEFIALTDVDVDATRIPLIHDWPGWWAKMELYRPDIAGDLLYCDLDSIIVGDCRELAAVGRTTMLNDFYRPDIPASGFMYLTEADRAAVWLRWIKSPGAHMARHKRGQNGHAVGGDQSFLGVQPLGRNAARWQQLLPGQVVSYKVHCRHTDTVPTAARVVCFHGKPRPMDTKMGARFRDGFQRGRKMALLVAHPDDETLWAAGLVTRYPGEWTVICCTLAPQDPMRGWHFQNACDMLNVRYRILPVTKRTSDDRLTELDSIDLSPFDLVVTHNEAGEYGHPHHKHVHEFAVAKNKQLPGQRLMTFGYGREQRPDDVVLDLTSFEWNRKVAALQKYTTMRQLDNQMIPTWKSLIREFGTPGVRFGFNLKQERFACC